MSWPGPIPSIGALLGPPASATVEPTVSTTARLPTGVPLPSARDRLAQALSHLLPQGYAWPRAVQSVWMRVVRGLAGVFDEHHRFAGQAVNEWQPHATRTRLAEWEEATGLPDACFGADQSFIDRRDRVLARLRGPQLAYDDSSPACIDAIVSMCAQVGYTAKVAYVTPFRVGRNQVGDTLGALDGRLQVTVARGRRAFHVGDSAGQRLAIFLNPGTRVQTFKVGSHVGEFLNGLVVDDGLLECHLRPAVPARFKLVVNFTGAI